VTGNATWKVGGSGGVTDHALLTHLAYADAGHTGFAANPAVADLDMGGYNITDVKLIFGVGTSSFVEIGGGYSAGGGGGGVIALHGKTSTGSEGQIQFVVPNAAGNYWALAGYFDGVTDTPKLHLEHALDMNSKKIEATGDITSGTTNTYDIGKIDNLWKDVFATDVFATFHKSGDSYLTDEKLYLGSATSIIECDDEIQFKPSNVHSATFARNTWGGLKIDKLSELTPSAGITISHTLDMNAKNITSLADPRAGYPQDAATKAYVDAHYPSGGLMGDIVYHNGSTWTRLPAGTAGRVLTTQGGGANPSWAPCSGGSGADYTIDGGNATSVYTGTATIDCGAAA
jgi:hypothetical protein